MSALIPKRILLRPSLLVQTRKLFPTSSHLITNKHNLHHNAYTNLHSHSHSHNRIFLGDNTRFAAQLRQYHQTRPNLAKDATPYDVLGVKSDASMAELKQAYHNLARMYHPDTNSDADAEDTFVKVNDAFSILGEEKSRQRYDRERTLKQEGPEGFARTYASGYTYYRGYKNSSDDFQFYKAAKGGGKSSAILSNTNVLLLSLVWMLLGIVVHLWWFSEQHEEVVAMVEQRSKKAAESLDLAQSRGRENGPRVQLEMLKQQAAAAASK